MEILLARQPIFDKSERLAGYRLSYAAGESVPAPSHSPESAASIDKQLLEACLTHGLTAHFCEHLAPESKAQRARGPLFLVGLFSTLDALVGVPMPVLVQQLELTNDVAEALTSRAGFNGAAPSLVESYESGAWAQALERAAKLGVQTKDLRPLYTDSIQWARAQVPS